MSAANRHLLMTRMTEDDRAERSWLLLTIISCSERACRFDHTVPRMFEPPTGETKLTEGTAAPLFQISHLQMPSFDVFFNAAAMYLLFRLRPSAAVEFDTSHT